MLLLLINAEFIAVGMSFGNGKINDEALSAAEINLSLGFESVLRRDIHWRDIRMKMKDCSFV